MISQRKENCLHSLILDVAALWCQIAIGSEPGLGGHRQDVECPNSSGYLGLYHQSIPFSFSSIVLAASLPYDLLQITKGLLEHILRYIKNGEHVSVSFFELDLLQLALTGFPRLMGTFDGKSLFDCAKGEALPDAPEKGNDHEKREYDLCASRNVD
ncbi:hypothetical protein F52700_5793 [Fusarium sp. NRRL 52700]|nr:hypothetical protein F52700_5793 [Fusarium sp. NRRL 52700]